ncbi:hypothetical protein AYR62_07185 [Secundilactobacillus paracollinoides]|uniref:DNA translocase FtsK n=1 Tax=Secundilactobacillus paracollinoides TaxID=240427 RepID=UPI00081A7D38|nr:DNA translocase FtsK [Secundilactobacillus paracollinoides]ANZ63894.1 hypothetical protein AYR62_07185 [Secundilactobacillus paracollinoides]
MTHYDGPAFYRKYRLPRKNRKLNAAAPAPEATPIKRTYHLPSEGDAQTQRVRQTQTRQNRPAAESRPQLPPRETDAEMRHEVEPPRPSAKMTSTNDWRTDRPFRVTAVPRQLHHPSLASPRVNFTQLVTRFFKKQDSDVLLLSDANVTEIPDAMPSSDTTQESMQFVSNEAVSASASGVSDTADDNTTVLDEGAATTQASPSTVKEDGPSIHNWQSDADTTDEVSSMSETVPEAATDVQPSEVQPSISDIASVEDDHSAGQTSDAIPSSESTDDGLLVSEPTDTSDQTTESAPSETPVEPDQPENLQEAAVSERDQDDSGLDNASDQADEQTESDESQVAADSNVDGDVDTRTATQPEVESSVNAQTTLESPLAAHDTELSEIDVRADPSTDDPTTLISDQPDQPNIQQDRKLLDHVEESSDAAQQFDTSPVAEIPSADIVTDEEPTAGHVTQTPSAPKPGATSAPATNTPTPAPKKPAEAQHGLGHSLGDILNEENAQLKDLALFQDKPDVQGETVPLRGYQFPSPDLLTPPVIPDESALDEWIEHQGEVLDETLAAFHVDAHVVDWTIGPTVTQFQVHLSLGVKVNKITNLTDDLKLALAAKDIRIEAPIPGKSTVGIEIPNPKTRPVMLSEVLESKAFKDSKSPLTVALGVDLFGKPQVTDLRKMPHGLIAGATGSGKSVFINSLLISLLYKATPADLRLLLIDPKAVELAPYDKLPHLLAPVISDPQAAAAALKWAVNEMDDRYDRLAAAGVRNIEQYNERAELTEEYSLNLPYIVIVIDELADLMMMASSEVQDYIVRITQKARAAGIHLLIATQRPSVDIVTGTIKNNIPTRVAFMVSSQVDSRTIIDTSGAERLLGKGDMLFLGNGASQPVRLQGTFVDDEVDRVTDFVRTQGKPHYEFDPDGLLAKEQSQQNEDELMPEVLDYIVQEQTVSTSKLQRVFSIGYNRAANMIDTLENKQYISGQNGSKPRDVFLTAKQLAEMRGPRTD